MDVTRGHLAGTDEAPPTGEHVDALVAGESVVVEHIISGRLESPVDYDQDRDEWVAVLEGSANLEIGGERMALVAGDWLVIPRRTPHRLLETAPGTRWLAVHFG